MPSPSPSRSRRDDLPHRPRLTTRAVLLDRPGGELQVGLGPEAVCIRDDDHRWRAMLPRCLGRVPLDRLLEQAGLAESEAASVLIELARRGLLESAADRRAGRPPTGPRVSLVGAGPLGLAVALALARAEVDDIHVVDESTPDAATYPHSTAGRRSEALCEQVRRGLVDEGGSDVRPARMHPTRRPTNPGGSTIGLVVIASETLEPDRVLTEDLTRGGQPHLVVRPLPGGVVVGPLVVPGRSACLRCCDLTRRDADEHWPQLMSQLCRMPAVPSPTLRGWAAGLVATQVEGFLAGRRVDTLGGSVELTRHDPRQQWRGWPLHPECGCRW